VILTNLPLRVESDAFSSIAQAVGIAVRTVQTYVLPVSLLLFPLHFSHICDVSLADRHLLDDASLSRGSTGSGDGWLARFLLEDLPELERFVSGSSGEHLAIGAQAAVQDTGLVGRNLHVLHASRVAPDAERVVGEATSADNLLVVGAPSQAGNLGIRRNGVDASSGRRVPEMYLAIVGTTTSSEEVGLPRAPRHSLDGSTVVGLSELGSSQGAGIPNGDQVVVGASGELSTVGAPLETTDFASVRRQLSNLVLCDANIVVEDETGASAGGENVLVPAHDANARVVTEHAAELGTLLDVPDLNLTRTEANADVGTVTGPFDRRDICVGGALKEGRDRARVGRPHVDGTLQANGDLVPG